MLSSVDLGLELLISIIRMTLPSVLVQINFRNIKMNAEPLTPEFVNYQPGWVGHSRVSLSVYSVGVGHSMVSLSVCSVGGPYQYLKGNHTTKTKISILLGALVIYMYVNVLLLHLPLADFFQHLNF